MAVKIRLTRTGATNSACYRVVAADTRSPRDGRRLEILGWYDPGQTGVNFKLKLDRIDHWIGEGAQVSDTAASLIRKARKLPIEEAVPVAETVEAAAVADETPEAVEEVPATADAD
ncbi:MAG: 30S ribosomal protein S16 [Verrucomicrobia bacterium]|jgi:small subunit ribosomal protein S16|nr:30S ribosomal protein S16 [Verrucomicrobiota bacterium]